MPRNGLSGPNCPKGWSNWSSNAMLERLVTGDRAGEKNMKMLSLIGVAMFAFAVAAYGQDKKTEGSSVVEFKLPKPAYTGTPKNIPAGTTAEKPTGKPRPP